VNASFERLLLAPISLEMLMFAKTAGAILFGIINAFVPIIMASLIFSLSKIHWLTLILTIILISISSTFLGLFIAVSVSEVFEAQTFSNFFRFPMLFLCGLFFPIFQLPLFLKPLAYIMPLTYGADLLHFSINQTNYIPIEVNLLVLTGFCVFLFLISLRNIRQNWIQ
jgi:ABC-2 type transport system permease protein